MTACNADNFGKFFRPENLFVAKISKFCIIDMKIYPNFVRENTGGKLCGSRRYGSRGA